MIMQSGNDYVVKVKVNQKKLLGQMKQIKEQQEILDNVVSQEKNRGRIERRMVMTYKVSTDIARHWKGAQTIVYLERQYTRKGRLTITHSYYLSSLLVSASEFAKGIRHHWGIENRLHYVKDVSFKEDASKIKRGNAPGILSLVRNLTINIARINGQNQIKKFIRQCTGNFSLLVSFLE
jgi:predicted transposase YbfD/YdcC